MFYTVCFKNTSQEVFGSTSIMNHDLLIDFSVSDRHHVAPSRQAASATLSLSPGHSFVAHRPRWPAMCFSCNDSNSERTLQFANLSATFHQEIGGNESRVPLRIAVCSSVTRCPVLSCIVSYIFSSCACSTNRKGSAYQTNIRQMSSFKNPQDFPLNSQVSSFAATFAPLSRPALWLAWAAFFSAFAELAQRLLSLGFSLSVSFRGKWLRDPFAACVSTVAKAAELAICKNPLLGVLKLLKWPARPSLQRTHRLLP